MSNELQLSLEAIAFQTKKNFVRELISLFGQILAEHKNPSRVQALQAKITSLTLDTTGIWLEPHWEEAFLPWILGPYVIKVNTPNLNALSPINKKAVEKLRDFDLDNIRTTDLLTGTIDYANGKMTGFYSQIRHDLFWSKNMFEGDFVAEEITALYLHELGHGWTNLTYMGETLVTNVILAEVVGQYNLQETVEKKYRVGQVALKLASVDKKLPKDADMGELTAIVLEGQINRMQKAAGTRWYDERLAEAIADQYAIRWGMGAWLVKALAKLERSTGIFANEGYEPVWWGVLMNFMNVAFLPFNGSKYVVRYALEPMVKAIASSFAFSLLTSGVATELIKKVAGANGHAPMPQRVAAIRREIVSQLKQPKLNESVRKACLADLEVVDNELENVHSFSDIYSYVTKYVANAFMGRTTELGRHDLIENLANNRLYEFSALLKG